MVLTFSNLEVWSHLWQMGVNISKCSWFAQPTFSIHIQR